MFIKTIRLLSLLALFTSIYGCASTGTTVDNTANYRGQTAEQIFTSAETSLIKHNYTTASEKFEALDTLYPSSKYAQRAHLDIIYAYYKAEDMAATATAAERYIKLYPTDTHVDYAYYLKGIANFNEDRGWLQRYFPTDLAARDPGTSKQAFDDFKQLICLYPNSRYASDARQRMIYLRNLLARYEMNVARYYYCRGAYVAAINRASNVLQHYQRSPSTPSALTLMLNAYQKLGLYRQANEVRNILNANQLLRDSVKY